jgi:hypothetical protein
MKPQETADTASAVADLQKKWNDLKDLERARAVHTIHQAGVSFRNSRTLSLRSAIPRAQYVDYRNQNPIVSSCYVCRRSD